MDRERVADKDRQTPTLAGEEASFRDALTSPEKLDKFLEHRGEERAKAEALKIQMKRNKHPWRYKVRDMLGNFWGTVSEGLNAMAYGMWVVIREALLPIIAVPTTWRRIYNWDRPCFDPNEVTQKGALCIGYALGNLGMILLAINSFTSNIATPATILWLISNFLSLSYEIGEAKKRW